jgi:hypothetical protein
MKRLIPIFFICCMMALSASALQPNETTLCCDLTSTTDSSPIKCLTEADLIGSNWVEKYDKSVSSTHRILAFTRCGQVDISTIFEDGFIESELTSWKLSHQNGKDFLSISDPVLGEVITYEVKTTDTGIQMKELGFDEAIEFEYASAVSEATF